MGDLINREAAINAVLKLAKEGPLFKSAEAYLYWNDAINECHHAIKYIPSAEPETAKRIVGRTRDGMTMWYQCEMCNVPVDEHDTYCCGCGRRLIDG